MFELQSLTKVRVLDVRVLAAKNRGPDDAPGGQILLSANLPSPVLAMFDGFLPGMLFRKSSGVDAKKQVQLDGMESMELTPIGDHVKRMPWQYEQTGCTLQIDYGSGGPSNIVLQDCKVHRVSFSPRDGGSVVVQWTVDAPGLEPTAWAKLPNLKATDVQMTLTGPEVDDRQARVDDEPAPKPAKKAAVIDGTKGHPGAATAAAAEPAGGWPFGDRGAANAPAKAGPEDEDSEGGGTDLEGRLEGAMKVADKPARRGRRPLAASIQ